MSYSSEYYDKYDATDTETLKSCGDGDTVTAAGNHAVLDVIAWKGIWHVTGAHERWEEVMKELIDTDAMDDFAQRTVGMHRRAGFHEWVQSCGSSWAMEESGVLQYPVFPPPSCSCSCDLNRSVISQLERVFASDYTPTAHDYLHFDQRQPVGIYREAQLERGAHPFVFIDVGVGMSSSCGRSKWMHFFTECQCVVFAADLTLYDQWLDGQHA